MPIREPGPLGLVQQIRRDRLQRSARRNRLLQRHDFGHLRDKPGIDPAGRRDLVRGVPGA
jgi:hypothetical protein